MGYGHSASRLKAEGPLSGKRYLCPWVVVTLVMGGGHRRPGHKMGTAQGGLRY